MDVNNFFLVWCDPLLTNVGVHELVTIFEKEEGRNQIQKVLGQVVRSHYEDPKVIAEDFAIFGFEKTSELLNKSLPQSKKIRSGDLGEILGTEYINQCTSYRVPIYRLRFKDDREWPMRGDDLIGIKIENGNLFFLKGEAKSGGKITQVTIQNARTALQKNEERPSSITLNFIAKRLNEREIIEDKRLSRLIKETLANETVHEKQIKHMIFIFSGNGVVDLLFKELDSYKGNIPQHVVAFSIKDHSDFISYIYQQALDLGN